MRPILLISAAVSGCCLLLCACTGPQVSASVASARTTADWQAGEYAVSFRAGPVVDSGRKSFSFYGVKKTLDENRVPESVVVESAFSIDSFRSGYATKPESYVKLFTCSSGKTLLIEEEIPNDCAECTSWILVRAVEGELTCLFPDLPYRIAGISEPRPGERPTITRVSENEISFRYLDGPRRTVAVKDVVKKEQRPTFPG